jgi:hypothetical protein
MTPVIDSAELVRLSRTSIADENADERPRGSVPPRQAEASLLQLSSREVSWVFSDGAGAIAHDYAGSAMGTPRDSPPFRRTFEIIFD